MVMHRMICIAALICMTSAILLSQNPVVTPPEAVFSKERNILKVDVDLVNVSATVIDESGKYVEDLTAEDFRVLEDGREQTISFFSHETRLPISLGVLIDNSGSLQDKLRQALQTVRGIAATLSPDDEMFVITFNSRVDIKQHFTSNPEEMQRSLRDLHAHGDTAVYDAIAAGLREMQTARNEKRILLLVTDGFDSKSKVTAAQAEDLLNRSNVLLYAIGIDDDNNDNSIRRRTRYHIYDYMLNKLSSAGRGRLIRLYTGRDYDLSLLAQRVLGELHQEYTIGYYPAVRSDESSRSVEVHVTKPGTRILNERLFQN
jgi:VWFA-related protein